MAVHVADPHSSPTVYHPSPQADSFATAAIVVDPNQLSPHAYMHGVASAHSLDLQVDAMRPKVTDEELEKLEDEPVALARAEDDEARPRKAPPLPLEHIYVHDDQFPLRLTDFEVMSTLGEPGLLWKPALVLI